MPDDLNPLTDPGFTRSSSQPTPQPTVSTPDPQSQVANDPTTDPGFTRSNPLSATYRKVMDSNPTQNAKVLNLASKSGLSPQQVSQNPDSVDKAVNGPSADYLDNLHKDAPVTAKWLGDKNENMASAQKQIPGLAKSESGWQDFEKSSMNAMAEVLKYDVQNTPFEQGGIGPLSWNADDVKNLTEKLQNGADAIANPDMNQDALDEYHKGNKKPLEAQIISSIPNLAKTVAEWINPEVGIATTINESTGQAFDSAKAAGLSNEMAGASALVKGTITTGTTILTMGLLHKLYTPLAGQIGHISAREAIQKGIVSNLTTNAAFLTQGQIQDLSTAYTNTLTGEDPKAFDKFKENFATNLTVGVAQNVMLTALPFAHLMITKGPEAGRELAESDKNISGRVQGTIGEDGIPNSTKGKSIEDFQAEAKQKYSEQKAEVGKKAFEGAIEGTKDIPLYTDNPIQAKEHQEAVNEKYGGQTAHFPSEAFQTLHQDDAPKIAEELGPEFKKSYDQAQETGGTVHGPLSDVLANADKVKASELADHVKFGNDPNDKTVTEAKEGKDELATKQKETEDERKTQLANFEQSIKGKIENVGGKASEGSAVQAKGIAKILDNVSKTLNVPISKLLQLYKFKILKEPKPVGELSERDKFNNHYQQAQDLGISTAADYVKKTNHLIFVPREEGESKEAWKARTKDAGNLVKVTDDPNAKTGMTYQQFAEDIGNAYESKEINDSGLPREWFDANGRIQKPDASQLDDVLSIIANSGSGVESVEKMEGKFQEYHQSGIDPFGLSKEDEKDIFGNVIKPQTRAEKEFPDTFVKPNDKAVDQDMFPTANGKKGEVKAQQELFQGHRGKTIISGEAGDPQGRSFETYVGAGADQSTLFHEFAHNFLQIFRDHVGQEDATDEAKDMEQKMLKWFGVDKWDDVTDRHSEMFARGFEYRLWEGKSPTGLQKVFQTFANWLRKIYPSSDVMSGYLKSVGATMTDEMRGVYDRFIASSEEIERAEKDMGYKSKAPEGLSPEEFNEWKSKQDSATQKAMDSLNSRKMEGLKKDSEEQIGKERERADKKATEDVDKLPIFQAKKDFEENTVSEFAGKSKEIAEKYLEGKATPIENDAIQWIADQHQFNSGADLAYGLANSDRAKEIKDRVNAHMQEFLPKVNGNPDEIQNAMLKGDARSEAIATEGALIKKLIADIKDNELKGKTEQAQGNRITSITDKKPEPLTKEQANENRKKALEQARKDQANAKARATEIMADTTLKDARDIRSYLADMKNAAKKSQEFQDKGNLKKAAEWKDKQLLNHNLALQAVKNRDFITRSIKALQTMGKIEQKPLKMPLGHWFQIKNVLESFGMKQPKPIQEYTFKKIAQDMLNSGKDNNAIADATGLTADEDGKLSKETLQQFKQRVMESNAQLATRINVPKQMKLSDMTLGDLRDIKNSVEAIYEHGRDADNLTLAGKKTSFKYWKAQALTAVADSRGKTVTEQTPEGPKDKTIYRHDIDLRDPAASKWTGTEDVINHLLNVGDVAMGYIRQFPRIAKELDGGDKGPWNDMVNTLMDSSTTKKTLEDERSTLHRELMEKYYSPKEQEDLISKKLSLETTKGMLQPTKTMSRAVYEYSGTKEGLNYLKTGLGYTDEDLKGYRDLLDEKDLDFIHEFNEKLIKPNWPKYVAKEMELNHVEPKPVDLLPVETKHGIRTGVYRPLIPDRLRSTGLSQGDEETELKSGYQQAAGFSPFSTQVDKSFLKERSGVKGIAPDLSDLVWQRYHEQTENYMAYQGELKEINKINNDKEIQQVLKRALGESGAKLFKAQTDYVSSGQALREGAMSKVAGSMRNLVVGSAIGYRAPLFVLKALTDATNLFFGEHGGAEWAGTQIKNGGIYFGISIPKEGGTSVDVGIGGPGTKALIAKVNALSVDMRHQGTNYDFNAKSFSTKGLFTNMSNLLGKTARTIQQSKLIRFVGLNTYMMERSADKGMRYPRWMQEYQSEKANGSNDQDAIRHANKVTNNILSTAEPLWQIGPMRGGELERQIAPVLSFASNQFNQFLDVYNKGANSVFKNGVTMKPGMKVALAMACAGGVMQFFVAPAIYKTAMNVATGKQKWGKDLPKDLAWETGSEAFNGVPGAGYAFNAARSGIEQHRLETDLPFQNAIEGNWNGLTNLHKLSLDEMSEDAWNKEFTAFSDDTSFPKTVQILSMNFLDHLNRQDDWQLKDFFRKRTYLGAKGKGGGGGI